MLPKIKHPVFSLDLPISKKKIKFRPMLVKEEKMLLLAKDGNSDTEILDNFKAVIQNCVQEKLDIDNLPLVEVEYIFLNLRSKSINNIISVRITDPYDPNIKHKVDIDLDDVSIKTSSIKDVIKLQDDIGIKLKVPTITTLRRLDQSTNEQDISLNTLKDCIDCVFDSETTYRIKDMPEDEVDAFIDSLSASHVKMIKEFFDNLPRLNLEVVFTDSKGKENKRTLDTFYDFFQ